MVTKRYIDHPNYASCRDKTCARKRDCCVYIWRTARTFEPSFKLSYTLTPISQKNNWDGNHYISDGAIAISIRCLNYQLDPKKKIQCKECHRLFTHENYTVDPDGSVHEKCKTCEAKKP